MKTGEMIGYWIGQCLGAIFGAGVLLVIVRGGSGYLAGHLGQNGWGPGYMGGYSLPAAIIFEFVATLIFVVVILGSTQEAAPSRLAGLAIGITLTAIHLVGINITGTSVNPARSLGPALLVGGQALSQVWLFLTLPSLGGLVAGLLFRLKALEVTAEPQVKEKHEVVGV
jgi:aquaporin Z